MTRALELGATQTRLYWLRSDLRRQLGDVAGAEADRREAWRKPPATKRAGSSGDLPNQKPCRNPPWTISSRPCVSTLVPDWRVRNKAYVLGEIMHRLPEAVAVLDQLIRLYAHPDDVMSRAVLRARMGDRQQSVTDVSQALKRPPTPKRLFQLACVFSLLGGAADLEHASSYLDQATVAEPQWLQQAYLDPDLTNLRSSDLFREVASDAQRRLKRQNILQNILISEP